jgi:hypothetical protein
MTSTHSISKGPPPEASSFMFTMNYGHNALPVYLAFTLNAVFRV